MFFVSRKKIMKLKLPEHIAFILDGNGRWAKKRGLPRNMGHYRGAWNLVNIAKECQELGVKYLTVYAFSTENWRRPEAEVNYLMETPVKEINKYLDKIIESGVKINFIGLRNRVPKETLELMIKLEKLTNNNKGINLLVAFDYGSRAEIVEAVKKITHQALRYEIKETEITEELLSNNLYTYNAPDPDLLIRTAGEVRLSNFLLWQLSYSEFYFSKKCFPAFNKRQLLKAIADFQKRKRNYGGLKEIKNEN